MKKKNTSRNLAAITVVAFSAIFLSSCGDNKTSAGLEKGLACTGNSEVLTEGSDHAVEQAEQQVTEECVTPEEAPTIANKQPLAAATTDSNIGTLRFLQYAPVSKSCDGPNCLIFVTETLRQPMINPDENILIAYQDHPDLGSATEGTLKLQCNQQFNPKERAAITGEFRVKLCHSTKARNRRMCVTVFARPSFESFSRTVINDSCNMGDSRFKGDLADFCDEQDLKLAVKNSGTLLTKNRKGSAKKFHSLRNCSAQIISGDGTTVAKTKRQFGFLPYRLDGVKFQSHDVRRLSTLAPGNSDGAMCVHSGGSSFSSSQKVNDRETGPCPLAYKPQKNANFKQGGPIEAVFFTSTGLVPPSFYLEKRGEMVPLVLESVNRKRLGLEACLFPAAGRFGDIARLRCYQHTVTLGYDTDRAEIAFNESHGQDYRITTRGLSQVQRKPASMRSNIFTIDDPDPVSRPPADNPDIDCDKLENASHPVCIADFFR